jgi:hypothetical protein
MDFFEQSTITVNEQTMWGFIKETLSTSCVAGRGHPTVLWGIRGGPSGHIWPLKGKIRVTDSKNGLFLTKAPSKSMSRQCGDFY